MHVSKTVRVHLEDHERFIADRPSQGVNGTTLLVDVIEQNPIADDHYYVAYGWKIKKDGTRGDRRGDIAIKPTQIPTYIFATIQEA